MEIWIGQAKNKDKEKIKELIEGFLEEQGMEDTKVFIKKEGKPMELPKKGPFGMTPFHENIKKFKPDKDKK